MCIDPDCEPPDPARRTFLIAAGAALAGLGLHGADAAAQQEAAPPTRVLDDPSIEREQVTFKHAGKDTFGGFLARPKGDHVSPAVLVIAGNRITEEYIPNTCAALAKAGFVGLAPDIFHPLPAGARTKKEMDAALADHKDDDVLLDVQVGADYLRRQPFVKAGRVGVIGFCYGGRIALLFAARTTQVGAVVAYHPGIVAADEVSRLDVPVQFHHGTADKSVDVAKSRELAAVLEKQRTPVELFAYEGADHGFLAYTRPMYRPDDAKLAWARTIEFLRAHVAP